MRPLFLLANHPSGRSQRSMSDWIAALPMYDWPELRAETDAQWAAIRDRLRAAGIAAPQSLTRENAPSGALDLAALWRDPALLLAQTCWGPMGLGLARHVQVVGQADYSGCEGGDGELYSSALVMRRRQSPPRDQPAFFAYSGEPSPNKGEKDRSTASDIGALGRSDGGNSPSPLQGGRGEGRPISGPSAGEDMAGKPEGDAVSPSDGRAALQLDLLRGRRFAFNSRDSMSGYLALGQDLAACSESFALFCEQYESGGHRASIRAVAEDRADVASIDCRSWQLFRRFEPDIAAGLQVVGWTARRKGLPFVTAKRTPQDVVAVLKDIVADMGQADRGRLVRSR